MSRPDTIRDVHRVRLRQVRDGRVRFKVDRIDQPQDVFDAVKRYYTGADREILSVLCLDAQNRPTCFHVASMGGLNTTRSKPADVLKVALVSNALSIILIHNHPSGELEPSPEDVEFTRAISRACELMAIELFDHLIVTDEGFCSLREQGVV